MSAGRQSSHPHVRHTSPIPLTWNKLSKIWQVFSEVPDTGCWGGLCLLDMILTLPLLVRLLCLLLFLLASCCSRACHDSGATWIPDDLTCGYNVAFMRRKASDASQ